MVLKFKYAWTCKECGGHDYQILGTPIFEGEKICIRCNTVEDEENHIGKKSLYLDYES